MVKNKGIPYRFTCEIPCRVVKEPEEITEEEEKVLDEEIKKANEFFFGKEENNN
jgi:hypothetical protein